MSSWTEPQLKPLRADPGDYDNNNRVEVTLSLYEGHTARLFCGHGSHKMIKY